MRNERWIIGALCAALVLMPWRGSAVAADDTGEVQKEPDPQPRVVLPDESAYTRSAQDGGGSVTVEPASVRSRRPCTLTFTYTVGNKGIATGGGVLCYVTRYWRWAPPQSLNPRGRGYCTVTCSNADVELAIETDPQSQTILAHVAKGTLQAGDRLTFVYGDTSGGSHTEARGTADDFAEREERFFFKVDGDGDGWFAPVAEQPRFEVLAGEAARLMVFGPSRASVGESFELRVSVLDAVGNLAESFVGEVDILCDATTLETPRQVTFQTADRGSVGVRAVAKKSGITRAAAQDKSQHLFGAVSNVMVFHDHGEETLRLYWADLQIHGNLSDGTGIPADIYRYARDVARLDAAALTEHDHWGYLPLDETDRAWQRCLAASRKFNDPGRFVAFPGYEWTSWTFGHQHVLFLREQEAVVRAWNNTDFDHPLELWKALKGSNSITIPHHPGGGPIPVCWKYYDRVRQPVVEIASVHGVSERMGQPGCIYSPEESGMAQSALARGHRLGFIGGGDTHDGHPGLGSPGMPPPGLAGIYAKELTREALFEALRARRVYATNGCRAILRFHSGSVPMGGVIKLKEPGERRRFDVVVVGDGPVASVTIVKNNVDTATFDGGGLLVSHTWKDPAPARAGDYYYARIAQTDGGWIWSSPIWVELEQ